ncbi:Uncharacterised protein [uncultured Blautia sp.]|nr:Uncharacterised protein [uncultured Blautia sp.]
MQCVCANRKSKTITSLSEYHKFQNMKRGLSKVFENSSRRWCRGAKLKKRVSADFPMSAQKYGGFDQKSTLTFSIFYPILLYGVNMSLNFHKNNFRR